MQDVYLEVNQKYVENGQELGKLREIFNRVNLKQTIIISVVIGM